MHRLNLVSRPTGPGSFDLWSYAVFVLLIGLGLQSSLTFWHWLAARQARQASDHHQNRLSELEAQLRTLTAGIDAPVLAGAVAARNVWLEDKARSPARLLATLERNRAVGVTLKRFDAGLPGGSLKIEAGDMETVMRWLNSSFAGMKGKTSVEERSHGRLTVGFTWTE
jgi:hypothetical protein